MTAYVGTAATTGRAKSLFADAHIASRREREQRLGELYDYSSSGPFDDAVVSVEHHLTMTDVQLRGTTLTKNLQPTQEPQASREGQTTTTTTADGGTPPSTGTLFEEGGGGVTMLSCSHPFSMSWGAADEWNGDHHSTQTFSEIMRGGRGDGETRTTTKSATSSFLRRGPSASTLLPRRKLFAQAICCRKATISRDHEDLAAWWAPPPTLNSDVGPRISEAFVEHTAATLRRPPALSSQLHFNRVAPRSAFDGAPDALLQRQVSVICDRYTPLIAQQGGFVLLRVFPWPAGEGIPNGGNSTPSSASATAAGNGAADFSGPGGDFVSCMYPPSLTADLISVGSAAMVSFVNSYVPPATGTTSSSPATATASVTCCSGQGFYNTPGTGARVERGAPAALPIFAPLGVDHALLFQGYLPPCRARCTIESPQASPSSSFFPSRSILLTHVVPLLTGYFRQARYSVHPAFRDDDADGDDGGHHFSGAKASSSFPEEQTDARYHLLDDGTGLASLLTGSFLGDVVVPMFQAGGAQPQQATVSAEDRVFAAEQRLGIYSAAYADHSRVGGDGRFTVASLAGHCHDAGAAFTSDFIPNVLPPSRGSREQRVSVVTRPGGGGGEQTILIRDPQTKRGTEVSTATRTSNIDPTANLALLESFRNGNKRFRIDEIVKHANAFACASCLEGLVATFFAAVGQTAKLASPPELPQQEESHRRGEGQRGVPPPLRESGTTRTLAPSPTLPTVKAQVEHTWRLGVTSEVWKSWRRELNEVHDASLYDGIIAAREGAGGVPGVDGGERVDTSASPLVEDGRRRDDGRRGGNGARGTPPIPGGGFRPPPSAFFGVSDAPPIELMTWTVRWHDQDAERARDGYTDDGVDGEDSHEPRPHPSFSRASQFDLFPDKSVYHRGEELNRSLASSFPVGEEENPSNTTATGTSSLGESAIIGNEATGGPQRYPPPPPDRLFVRLQCVPSHRFITDGVELLQSMLVILEPVVRLAAAPADSEQRSATAAKLEASLEAIDEGRVSFHLARIFSDIIVEKQHSPTFVAEEAQSVLGNFICCNDDDSLTAAAATTPPPPPPSRLFQSYPPGTLVSRFARECLFLKSFAEMEALWHRSIDRLRTMVAAGEERGETVETAAAAAAACQQCIQMLAVDTLGDEGGVGRGWRRRRVDPPRRSHPPQGHPPPHIHQQRSVDLKSDTLHQKCQVLSITQYEAWMEAEQQRLALGQLDELKRGGEAILGGPSGRGAEGNGGEGQAVGSALQRAATLGGGMKANEESASPCSDSDGFRSLQSTPDRSPDESPVTTSMTTGCIATSPLPSRAGDEGHDGQRAPAAMHPLVTLIEPLAIAETAARAGQPPSCCITNLVPLSVAWGCESAVAALGLSRGTLAVATIPPWTCDDDTTVSTTASTEQMMQKRKLRHVLIRVPTAAREEPKSTDTLERELAAIESLLVGSSSTSTRGGSGGATPAVVPSSSSSSSWVQSESLFADMCRFKYVNSDESLRRPQVGAASDDAASGSVDVTFADFIRWHSPRDFVLSGMSINRSGGIQRDLSSSGTTTAVPPLRHWNRVTDPLGLMFLSPRMQANSLASGSPRPDGTEDNNLWITLWRRATPTNLPARRYNIALVASRALQELSDLLPPSSAISNAAVLQDAASNRQPSESAATSSRSARRRRATFAIAIFQYNLSSLAYRMLHCTPVLLLQRGCLSDRDHRRGVNPAGASANSAHRISSAVGLLLQQCRHLDQVAHKLIPRQWGEAWHHDEFSVAAPSAAAPAAAQSSSSLFASACRAALGHVQEMEWIVSVACGLQETLLCERSGSRESAHGARSPTESADAHAKPQSISAGWASAPSWKGEEALAVRCRLLDRILSALAAAAAHRRVWNASWAQDSNDEVGAEGGAPFLFTTVQASRHPERDSDISRRRRFADAAVLADRHDRCPTPAGNRMLGDLSQASTKRNASFSAASIAAAAGERASPWLASKIADDLPDDVARECQDRLGGRDRDANYGAMLLPEALRDEVARIHRVLGHRRTVNTSAAGNLRGVNEAEEASDDNDINGRDDGGDDELRVAIDGAWAEAAVDTSLCLTLEIPRNEIAIWWNFFRGDHLHYSARALFDSSTTKEDGRVSQAPARTPSATGAVVCSPMRPRHLLISSSVYRTAADVALFDVRQVRRRYVLQGWFERPVSCSPAVPQRLTSVVLASNLKPRIIVHDDTLHDAAAIGSNLLVGLAPSLAAALQGGCRVVPPRGVRCLTTVPKARRAAAYGRDAARVESAAAHDAVSASSRLPASLMGTDLPEFNDGRWAELALMTTELRHPVLIVS